MTQLPTRPLAAPRRGALRLYYRIVLGALVVVLVLQLLLQLAFTGSPPFRVGQLALYAAILLLSWFGYEFVRESGPDEVPEPKGLVLGAMALLLVAICLETGGLESPYYLLLFTTCVFGGVLMKPYKAYALTGVAGGAYVLGVWFFDGAARSPLQGGVMDFPARLAQTPGWTPNEAGLLLLQAGFLFLGSIVALHVAHNFQRQVGQLATDAKLDPLTQLPNRRGFTEKLAMEARRIREWDWPIAMLIIDLDHFKRVNDRFDHQVGDAVLVETARVMRETAGPLDHVARLGGEEFAVAAVGADRRHAEDLAERVLRAFREHDWDRIAPGLSPLTCSIGISTRPAGQDAAYVDFEELITTADRALLDVKKASRDAYRVAGDPPQNEGETPVLRRRVADAPVQKPRFIRH